LLFVLFWANVPGLRYARTAPDARLALYKRAGQWLRDHAPEQASVGALEVGILGYYAERRIIDFAGLVQPQVQAQMSHKATYQDTARWAIEQYRPDYITVYDGWFAGSFAGLLEGCQSKRRFPQPRGPLFTVYECEWTN
jgi:hypothetical protein